MSLRTILITGANGALGGAIARSFLEESVDNHVWLGVRSRRESADGLAREYPERCRCLELDVRVPEAWKKAIKEIVSVSGRLDVLVNNAGKNADSLLATMPMNEWEDVIATCLDGAFHGCQAVLPTMISQRSGRIVNVASLSALLPPAGQANYAAAKAGLVALSQSLAKEMARLNITVNVVCPGFVETEALKSLGAEKLAEAKARIPMRRFGRPEEVAAAVRFLACSAATYITGSVLKVDGGIL